MIRATILFVIALCVPQGTVCAQRTSRAALEEAYREGWYIRAFSRDSAVGVGRVNGLQADSVLIGKQPAAISQVTEIDRRLRAGAWKAGAIVGAGLFGVAAYAAASTFCENDPCQGRAQNTVAAAAAGAVIGGAIVYFVAPKYRWLRVYH
jgi:hypothetical protein